jgi:hypothetical protein
MISREKMAGLCRCTCGLFDRKIVLNWEPRKGRLMIVQSDTLTHLWCFGSNFCEMFQDTQPAALRMSNDTS